MWLIGAALAGAPIDESGWSARWDTGLNGPSFGLQLARPAGRYDLVLRAAAGAVSGQGSFGAAAGQNLRYTSFTVSVGTQGRFPRGELPDWLGDRLGWRASVGLELGLAPTVIGRVLEEARLQPDTPAVLTAAVALTLPLEFDAGLRLFITDRMAITVGPRLRYSVLMLTLQDNPNSAATFLAPHVGLEFVFPQRRHL